MGLQGRPPLGRTVILDYYDSYTNNLLALLTKLYPDAEVLSKVVVIKHDHFSWQEFRELVLPNIDCLILSPGPGRPDHPSDIGFALDLLRLDPTPVPILGVCLGHQAIAYAFGGKIINTPRITHGHVVSVRPIQPLKGLFDHPAWKAQLGGDDTFDVTVYNSLTVEPDSLPDELEITAWSASSAAADAEPTIQALRHKTKPIWGVQYHPESICSTLGAPLLLSFLSFTHAHHRRPASFPPLTPSIRSACAYAAAAGPSRAGSKAGSRAGSRPGTPGVRSSVPTAGLKSSAPLSIERVTRNLGGPGRRRDTGNTNRPRLRCREHRFGSSGSARTTEEVFRKVVWPRRGRGKGKEIAQDGEAAQWGGGLGAVWLDGENPDFPSTSSLAVPSFVLTYSLASRTIKLHRSADIGCSNIADLESKPSEGHTTTHTIQLREDQTFWGWFAELQGEIEALFQRPTPSLPTYHSTSAGCAGGIDVAEQTTFAGKTSRNESFRREKGWKGGWVGWMGYEMGAESLEGYTKPVDRTVSDSQGFSARSRGTDNGLVHPPDAGRGSQEGPGLVEEIDACWAWCPLVLERDETGEWVARGLVARDEEEKDVGDGCSGPPSVPGPSAGDHSSSAGLDGVRLYGRAEQDEEKPRLHVDAPEAALSSLDVLLRLLTASLCQNRPSASTLGASPASFDLFTSALGAFFSSDSPAARPGPIPSHASPTAGPGPTLDLRPIVSADEYMNQVDRCRAWIKEGESYELTLTTEFRGQLDLRQIKDGAAGHANGARSTTDSTTSYASSDLRQGHDRAPASEPDECIFATYLSLRSRNPAHYSAFLSFPFLQTPRGQGVHILSSSPERFLRITNEPVSPDPTAGVNHSSGLLASVANGLEGIDLSGEAEISADKGKAGRLRRVVEMKPIKGTRKRPQKGVCICPLPSESSSSEQQEIPGCGRLQPGGSACEAWRAQEDKRAGKELVADEKERAENLMIVDLIRSDLLTSCPPSTVTVPKLIALESHGVHHLVTTVRGELGQGVGTVDVLGRCFPPGSMTGAPKLRSVQLLSSLESRRRGLYSGCLGYISASDGTADLSVVIRTLVVAGDQVSLGAGGAVTWLSDRQKEWDEVGVKVGSVLGHRV